MSSSAKPKATYRTLCYFAREHGLAGLRSLLEDERFQPVCLLTHRRLPAAEDPERGERPEFKSYVALAASTGLVLFAVDSRAEREAIVPVLRGLDVDLIASISWRMLITPPELESARYGGVNLHRGRLPDYAGAEPIRQALVHGDTMITITAHRLNQEIDRGEVLVSVEHPAARLAGETIEERIGRLKREITPLFGPLLIRALERCVATGA
jgi:methionyl-tRNA formyltransferase